MILKDSTLRALRDIKDLVKVAPKAMLKEDLKTLWIVETVIFCLEA